LSRTLYRSVAPFLPSLLLQTLLVATQYNGRIRVHPSLMAKFYAPYDLSEVGKLAFSFDLSLEAITCANYPDKLSNLLLGKNHGTRQLAWF
jgi:hypothetical protein